MGIAGWIGSVMIVTLVGAGILALARLSIEVSNNNDDKEP